MLLNVPAEHELHEAAPAASNPPASGWKRPAAQGKQRTAAAQVLLLLLLLLLLLALVFDAHGAVAFKFATRPGAHSKQRWTDGADDDGEDGDDGDVAAE